MAMLSSGCLKRLVEARNKVKDYPHLAVFIEACYIDACYKVCNLCKKCPIYRKNSLKIHIEPEIDQKIHDFISEHVFLPKE